eukprot:COSAG01_NODE_15384_length_1344_cov_2.440964_1_plen_240_part_00
MVTRLFEATLLRENCRGGKRDWRNMFSQIKSWGKGHYREGFLRYIRPRVASRKAARAESLAIKHRRAVDLGAKGKIGAMAGVYDSLGVMPATKESLAKLAKLFPRQFVPSDCPRRAALRARLDALRELPPVQLNMSKFRKATRTLPKSASTWGSAHLLRCTAETRTGAELLKWLTERILSAESPAVCNNRDTDSNPLIVYRFHPVCMLVHARLTRMHLRISRLGFLFYSVIFRHNWYCD